MTSEFLPNIQCLHILNKGKVSDLSAASGVEKFLARVKATYLEKHRTHTNSSTSHRLTRASALPVAKYFPVGSNLMQIQFEGWALID